MANLQSFRSDLIPMLSQMFGAEALGENGMGMRSGIMDTQWMGSGQPQAGRQPTAVELAIANRTLGLSDPSQQGAFPPGMIRPQQSGVEVEEGAPRYLREGVRERNDAIYANRDPIGIDRQGNSQQASPEAQREAMRRAIAMREAASNRGIDQQNKEAGVNRNPWDVFGTGDGNWAQVWQNAMQPKPTLEGSLMGNQLSGFLNYGDQLNQQYNSPTGPYGQLQAAATMQRPYKAQENVARTQADADKYIADSKSKTALGFAEMVRNAIGGSPTAISTDYGAAVTPTYKSLGQYKRWKG
jgi:hypothetical protein